jgi:polyisoprenoid-binding protein YceI
MKKLSTFITAILVFSALWSCKNDASKAGGAGASAQVERNTGIAAIYETKVGGLNTIQWIGTKIGGKHNGTIKIQNGRLNLVGDVLTTGDFDIDMNSIYVTDLNGKEKDELEGHLKEGDFFETNKFPTGRFVITKAERVGAKEDNNYNIFGDLTLKGVTKPIQFPANVAFKDSIVAAQSNVFSINRTEFGINYSSGILGVAKDKLIHDDITLVVTMTAVRKKN